jgi:MoaA/NifB/PqqE/SkfB family radical SAM enzyme
MVAEMKRKPDLRFLPVFRSPESMLSYLEKEDSLSLPEVFHPCGAPYGAIFVTPGGDLFPCRIFYPVGNIRRKPFGDLWNSKALRQFRTRLRGEMIFPSCVRCCRLMER